MNTEEIARQQAHDGIGGGGGMAMTQTCGPTWTSSLPEAASPVGSGRGGEISVYLSMYHFIYLSMSIYIYVYISSLPEAVSPVGPARGEDQCLPVYVYLYLPVYVYIHICVYIYIVDYM